MHIWFIYLSAMKALLNERILSGADSLGSWFPCDSKAVTDLPIQLAQTDHMTNGSGFSREWIQERISEPLIGWEGADFLGADLEVDSSLLSLAVTDLPIQSDLSIQ